MIFLRKSEAGCIKAREQTNRKKDIMQEDWLCVEEGWDTGTPSSILNIGRKGTNLVVDREIFQYSRDILIFIRNAQYWYFFHCCLKLCAQWSFCPNDTYFFLLLSKVFKYHYNKYFHFVVDQKSPNDIVNFSFTFKYTNTIGWVVLVWEEGCRYRWWPGWAPPPRFANESSLKIILSGRPSLK